MHGLACEDGDGGRNSCRGNSGLLYTCNGARHLTGGWLYQLHMILRKAYYTLVRENRVKVTGQFGGSVFDELVISCERVLANKTIR